MCLDEWGGAKFDTTAVEQLKACHLGEQFRITTISTRVDPLHTPTSVRLPNEQLPLVHFGNVAAVIW